MDTLHSVLFYALAAVTVAGGLAAALLEARARALGLALVALGVAGLETDLGAGLAAAATLVALGGCALLQLGLDLGRDTRPGWEPAGLARQLGALGAAAAFAALAYLAFRGSYAPAWGATGSSSLRAVGLLLLNRDALATEALAAALLLAVAGGGLLARDRAR